MVESHPSYLETTSLRMLRNVIEANLLDRAPPMVVLGDTGAGKSSLLARMVQDFQAGFDCYLYRAHKQPSKTSSLHATIGRQWVPKSPPGVTTHTIFQALCNLKPGRPPLLLIDDADLLSAAELHGVLHLKHAVDAMSKTRFCLILTGHPSLEQRIAELNPKLGSQHICLRLRPLTRLDSELLVQRLGYELSKRQMTQLYRTSKGIPGTLLEMLVAPRPKKDRQFTLIKRRLPFDPLSLAIIMIALVSLIPPPTTQSHLFQKPLPAMNFSLLLQSKTL